MGRSKYPEADIWCPSCHSLYAQVFRVQVTKDVFEHVTEPSMVPSICNRCQVVLERRP